MAIDKQARDFIEFIISSGGDCDSKSQRKYGYVSCISCPIGATLGNACSGCTVNGAFNEAKKLKRMYQESELHSEDITCSSDWQPVEQIPEDDICPYSDDSGIDDEYGEGCIDCDYNTGINFGIYSDTYCKCIFERLHSSSLLHATHYINKNTGEVRKSPIDNEYKKQNKSKEKNMISITNHIEQIARKAFPGTLDVVKRNKLKNELTANKTEIESALNEVFIEEKHEEILKMNLQFSKDKE